MLERLREVDEVSRMIDEKVAARRHLTDEMVDFFEKRTERHIELVQKYCRVLNDEFTEVDGLEERGRFHDVSKLVEPERTPYIFITWDHEVDDYEIPDGVDKLRATRHHILTNAHHPEYHDDRLVLGDAEGMLRPEDRDWGPEGDLVVDATEMPAVDILEQVADCAAMSEELGANTVREWFEEKIGCRWDYGDENEALIWEAIGALEDLSSDGDGIL